MQIESRYVKLFNEQKITSSQLNELGISTDSIRFDGRTDTWSLCFMVTGVTGDELTQSLAIFALFENDYWGDMAGAVLAYFDYYSGDNVWKEIGTTYDDIFTALYDEGIVETVF